MDHLEIRVYEGADGGFTLYEDENDSHNYEKGAYSTMSFAWDDARKVLTINDRRGSFTGMLTDRKFNIVQVSSNNGVGMGPVEKYDRVVTYNGEKVAVGL